MPHDSAATALSKVHYCGNRLVFGRYHIKEPNMTSFHLTTIAAGAAIVLTAYSTVAKTPPHFHATIIPTLGEFNASGYLQSINNSGLVLLTVWIDGDDAYRAQLWDSHGGTPYLPTRAAGSLGETLHEWGGKA